MPNEPFTPFKQEFISPGVRVEDGEVRVTSDTGGQKGSKLPQFGWAPPGSLRELARAYGAGALKYSPTNYRAGYEWSLSVNALYRHLFAWLEGESIDPETQVNHLALVAWHCLALMYFEKHFPEKDDVRWKDHA